MSLDKYFIGDRVDFWHKGTRINGTIKSVKKKLFGSYEYVIAVTVFAGFDPDGIGRDKYTYYYVKPADILATTPSSNVIEEK